LGRPHVGPCPHDPKAAREPYEALVRAIGHQQVTAKAGGTIIARLKALYPNTAFPKPENIIAAELDALPRLRILGNEIATTKAVAEGALSGLIPPRYVASTPDKEGLIACILTIKGIGRWTVEMLLMFSLERMDISAGRRSRSARTLRSLPPKPKDLSEIGKAWVPHRTVTAWYLWPRERGNDFK
jgi:DNA-3-methyladenine glycosylase II